MYKKQYLGTIQAGGIGGISMAAKSVSWVIFLFVISASAAFARGRCAISNNYITIDGEVAFYFSDETERSSQLAQLKQSGFCGMSNSARCGANTNFVTMDGENALFSSDPRELIRMLISLTESGLCVADASVTGCSANSRYVTLKGEQIYYAKDATNLLKKLIELKQAGKCEE